MRIWIIDDYPDLRDCIRDMIDDACPDAIVKEFDSLRGNIRDEVSGPDIAIIDISAVCPINQAYMMGEFLWPFARKYPGAEIVVFSALCNIAREGVEECFTDRGCGNVVHFISTGPGQIEKLVDIIRPPVSRAN